jgi:hypothetical protein
MAAGEFIQLQIQHGVAGNAFYVGSMRWVKVA